MRQRGKISKVDINAVKALNQKYSYMVATDGYIWRFAPNKFANELGELVRDLNYQGWYNPKK